MNRHQVLTGAVNTGDQCFSVGSVEGVHFTAYATGCDIVILASDFQRVQIIPGATHGNIQVGCLDCSEDTGKIAASYGREVCIFEPTPLLHHDSSHKLDYQWYQTGTITTECDVLTLSWNTDGSRLLTGGDLIQMWKCPESPDDEDDEAQKRRGSVEFHLGDENSMLEWLCLWHCRTASPIHQMRFSPDGLLFATVGKADRLVKIWYENNRLNFALSRSDSFSPRKEEASYSFIYIAHPRAVTGFSWRKTSKHMPRGSVANMLITSCRDSICRIWCETVVPDDGLVDPRQIDPVLMKQNTKFHTARYRTQFMQSLKNIKQGLNARKRRISGLGLASSNTQPPQLPSMKGVHDSHKFTANMNGITPMLHFHLAASINPETDIPLLPTIGNTNYLHESNFVVHWLNNKELHFTLESERILQDLTKKAGDDGDESSVEDDEEGKDSANENEVEDEVVDDEEDDQFFLDNKDADFKRGPLIRRDNQISMESEESHHSRSVTGDAENGPLPDSKKPLRDSLDSKIEKLLRDWHQSADMLFMVHPVDGSFLVWLVEWLDEYVPCSFRQAQISFSSRIPHAFPVGDATTMSTNLKLYCNYIKPDIKTKLKSENKRNMNMDIPKIQIYSANASGKNSPGQSDNTLMPNVLMLSKHNSGSLNQWQISFAETSKFSMVLSVAHASRASGHRFRTNSAACHPVLPLLLTTSHHNMPNETDKGRPRMGSMSSWCEATGLCSELILWRVDPVGPLSKSGGITELARINAPHLSAFSNVAWVPTLLPSSTLGTGSNSPSALFVASDGHSLRVYQAVIDARTLLADVQRRKESVGQLSSSSSAYEENSHTSNTMQDKNDVFKIVSQQSTARPGCIVELDAIADAKQDWQQTQFLHIFQDQMITGQKNMKYDTNGQAQMEAIIDLRNITIFEENFFLVVIEKLNNGGSVLHMWRIIISSQPENAVKEDVETGYMSTESFYIRQGDEDDEEEDFLAATQVPPAAQGKTGMIKLSITTTKVCTQMLELPEGIEVISSNVAAGHLSSSSIYPACFAPYLFATPCSDGRIRFWNCQVEDVLDENGSGQTVQKYGWNEWEMMIRNEETSAIHVPGKPITVSCAYSGRVAIAYRMGRIRTCVDNPENKFVNLCVSIYECESTGGSEWVLEDTIELKNISIPDPKAEIDLSYIDSYHSPRHEEVKHLVSPTSGRGSSGMGRSASIPSLSTIFSVKKYIAERGNKSGMLRQKHLVQLDWVSLEDGSHILTVGVGSKILMYAPVSTEIAQATQKEQSVVRSPSHARPILQKSKSMTVPNMVEEIRWMKLRSIDLTTADGLPPLPMHVSWARDGILVVGMDNEMHVYSQWKGQSEGGDSISEHDVLPGGEVDKRSLTDFNLMSSPATLSTVMKRNTSFLKPSHSSSSLMLTGSSVNEPKKKDPSNWKKLSKSESTTSLQWIQDCGLFEAARIANPVLPQYHPKLLLELLNFGKIRRVKAILAHLTRCIAGSMVFASNMQPSKTRRMSLSASSPTEQSTLQEEVLDYIEINSIPPLPLYALTAADTDTVIQAEGKVSSPFGAPGQTDHDYSTLFATKPDDDDDFDTALMDEEDDVFNEDGEINSSKRRRHTSGSVSGTSNPNYFGPSQARTLTRHLTHTHLPGLSSLDQMYLLALADTVSNTSTDFSDKFAPDRAVRSVVTAHQQDGGTSAFGAGTRGYASAGGAPLGPADSMDDCGLRYMLAMRHHIYLINTLPMFQRARLQKEGLGGAYLVWAFHSEAEEELLSIIPGMCRGDPTWAELKQYGVGWWVRNNNTLRRCIEKVAKAAFNQKKEPLDAALYYLAMKKKNLLWGLFRSVSDTKMVDFFKHNFQEDRWRRAALKNAFALLGRQRFEHATAFFLLAGSVRDAIEVCLNKMDDIQLAMVIARLYETELDDAMPVNMKRILYEEILGMDAVGENYHHHKAHSDPFLRSMALWMLKDYSSALSTLLQSGTARNFYSTDDDFASYTANPSVFNFYVYLRTHPLLVRQYLATTALEKNKQVLLSGFTRGMHSSSVDQNVTYVDKITPMERRLYFATAHAHFKTGCPLLALEVLTKLPECTVMDIDSSEEGSVKAEFERSDSSIETGTININIGDKPQQNASTFDWSQPVSSKKDTSNDFDWGTPITFQAKKDDDDIDWSKPLTSNRFKDMDYNFDDDGDTKSDSEIESKDKLKSKSLDVPDITKDDTPTKPPQMDIMAQQLRFIACLKIMMEELSTLATGFEVDGGQLRYQLYIWLERECETLKTICRYGMDLTEQSEARKAESKLDVDKDTSSTIDRMTLSMVDMGKPTLHEVLKAEKLDFEAKLERMARRKQWLKANQQLLRTLLSYCSLQGLTGGGLASVRMELILLLQELQQEKTQQQLLSPLPFPTTLPLLSASIASSKTVISDPIRHLQCLSQDLLHSIVEFKTPPVCGSMLPMVTTLRNLSAALSACIYQCLCDSDNFIVSMNDNIDIGMEGFTNTNVTYQDSYLMAGAKRQRRCSSGDEMVTSLPGRWPGVTSLRTLLQRERDEEAPKLNILLCESLIGVYMSLLIHAVTTYDANILYRLVAHPFNERMWSALFGGGTKKRLNVAQPSGKPQGNIPRAIDNLSRGRVNLHTRLFGPEVVTGQKKEEKPTYREKFMPPEVSIISYFMTKFTLPPDERFELCTFRGCSKPYAPVLQPGVEEYDSEASIHSSDEEEEDEADLLKPQSATATNEHLDPNSYSWCVMRYAIIKTILRNMRIFLPNVGIELPELPVCSPLLQAVIKVLQCWEEVLYSKLELFNGPPDNYIPGCYMDTDQNGPLLFKYKSMLEPTNTPFVTNHHTASPCKRLWHYLVRQEYLQDVFIRYIFKKKKMKREESSSMISDMTDGGSMRMVDPVKIIHKEQDIITSFCINQANLNCITLSTQKEIIEMDIGPILDPPEWLEDETEYDIEGIKNPLPSKSEPEDFLVVSVAQDRGMIGASSQSSLSTPAAPGVIPAPTLGQTGRGGNVKNVSNFAGDKKQRMTKRQVNGVRRMGAHPNLPYYLTGAQDGCVKLWEWGHSQCITTPRQSGTHPKVTKILFNLQGNKFGVSDIEGSVCLWQVGLGANMSKPFLNLHCHNKTTYDFAFVGSSSLIASAGHSGENKNVCLWDTLLPQKSSLIQAFSCHDQGCPAIIYAPQHQVLISGGKKGEICIFDIRQRQLRHTFQGHDSSIRCLSLDPTEEYFVSGSSEGDVKLWGLSVHNLVASFPGEHSKSTLFRNVGSGVMQTTLVPDGHLYSCGADGSLKVRTLPDNDWLNNPVRC
ncbi:dmX-like protein 1 isoform X3 [Lineus longissimus]|uniref:dmX-like protein 1 isoform X3 n=1 Tax=Lineus longissimus TaxID=88925 RepID=UPI00315D1A8D